MQGGKEFLMRAHFGLPSVENEEAESKPPITVKFEIPYFTVSGIQVCWFPLTSKNPSSVTKLQSKHLYGKSCILFLLFMHYKVLSGTREASYSAYYTMNKVQHSQAFFVLLDLTKPKTPVGDNGYHVGSYQLC